MQPRDRLIANLQTYSGLDVSKIDYLKNICVVLEYFSRPNHLGGAMSVMANPEVRQLSGGKTVSWKDVPLAKVIKNTESTVKTDVPEAKRTEVWHKLFEGLPVPAPQASWEKPVYQPHEHPETPYSASRASRAKANVELIAALAIAVDMEPCDVRLLSAVITANDSWNGKNSGALCLGSDPPVTGGRLGRDHTLEDVPNHYVRDEVMKYILDTVPAEAQDRVQKAVFDDLSEEDLHAYAKCIKAKSEDEVAEEEAESSSVREKEERVEKIYQKQGGHLKNKGEAKKLLKLEQAIEAIDCDNIDLSPERRAYAIGTIHSEYGSCLRPNQEPTEAEKLMKDEEGLTWDCDQIRAMIARLVKYSTEGWTVDSFRKALGHWERGVLINFLQRRGPHAGAQLGLCGYAQEFFVKRQILGVPLPQPPETGVAPELRKRKREPLEDRAVNVIEKNVTEQHETNKARKVARHPEDGSIDHAIFAKTLAENAEHADHAPGMLDEAVTGRS